MGIQTTQHIRRRRRLAALALSAGVTLAFLCAALALGGLAWGGGLGAGAQHEASRLLGPTPTPVPPPVLVVKTVNAARGALVLSGAGTPGADIEYLGQRVGVVAGDGSFTLALPFNPGLAAIGLDAVDRHGRTTRLIQIPAQAAGVGQPSAIGRVRLVLRGTGTDTLVGRSPAQIKAEGVFLKLVVRVSNEQSEPLDLRGWSFALRDAQGRVYRPSEKAEFAYGWDTAEGRLSGRVVPPNTGLTGWALFDIALGARGLILSATSDGIGPQWAAELAVPDSALAGVRP